MPPKPNLPDPERQPPVMRYPIYLPTSESATLKTNVVIIQGNFCFEERHKRTMSSNGNLGPWKRFVPKQPDAPEKISPEAQQAIRAAGYGSIFGTVKPIEQRDCRPGPSWERYNEAIDDEEAEENEG